MSSLDDLIAAVEAGDKWSEAQYAMFGNGTDLVYAYQAAFDGSLDAALRLHEALLPGWAAAINTNGMAQVIGPAPDWHRHTGCATDNPARAWLLAVLKALKAQQP